MASSTKAMSNQFQYLGPRRVQHQWDTTRIQQQYVREYVKIYQVILSEHLILFHYAIYHIVYNYLLLCTILHCYLWFLSLLIILENFVALSKDIIENITNNIWGTRNTQHMQTCYKNRVGYLTLNSPTKLNHTPAFRRLGFPRAIVSQAWVIHQRGQSERPQSHFFIGKLRKPFGSIGLSVAPPARFNC